MDLQARYTTSRSLTARTRRVTPGGAQTASKRPERFPEGAFPAYLSDGYGATVKDVDGHHYVDWICGLGAVPLGYNYEPVNEAILWQLERGLISSSLPTELEAKVAEKLIQIIPCAQDEGQVRFVKTGSEACSAAIRVARRYTGRSRILVVGYHGWHDWVQQTSVPHPGVPEDGQVIRVPYNDADCIADAMRSGPVAAVMLEPTLLEPPKENYLSDVCTLCTLHGAVSIFDEMVTGFRWARAGGQEYFRVTPDLAVFGKGLANGMPLAALVGPARFLKFADVISGTFGGECLSLAAARVVLDAYDEQAKSSPIAIQWLNGHWFLQECAHLGIPTTGYAVHPKITYTGRQMALFLQETARRGLLLHPAGLNVSAALTSDDLKITQRALEGAKQALDHDPTCSTLEGSVPPESLFRRQT